MNAPDAAYLSRSLMITEAEERTHVRTRRPSSMCLLLKQSVYNMSRRQSSLIPTWDQRKNSNCSCWRRLSW